MQLLVSLEHICRSVHSQTQGSLWQVAMPRLFGISLGDDLIEEFGDSTGDFRGVDDR